MATKKQNRRTQVRRARRVLNETSDLPSAISGRRLNQSGWGHGVGRGEFAPGPGQLAEDDDTWDDVDPRD